MVERGIVSRVEGDTAYVVFKRTSACGRCKACGMLRDMSEIEVDVPNSAGACPGDRVAVEFDAGNSLRSALLAYGVPLIFLIIGVALGYIISGAFFPGAPADMVAAVCAILFTGLGFLIIRLLDGRIRRRMQGVFRMIAKIDKEIEE